MFPVMDTLDTNGNMGRDMAQLANNDQLAYTDIPTNHNAPSKPGLCTCSIGVHSDHGHISQEPDIVAQSCLVSFLGIIGVLRPTLLPRGLQGVPEKRSHFSLNRGLLRTNENWFLSPRTPKYMVAQVSMWEEFVTLLFPFQDSVCYYAT